jgi:amino acid transporter
MNLYALTAMTFLSVSGGPIGMEIAMIGSDIYTILLCLTWLLVTYIIPIAYMSYELAIEFKDRQMGGPIGWVQEALGRRWGIANAVWDLIDTHIDNSIYPVLFADNVISLGVSEEYKSLIAWGVIVAVFIVNLGEIEGLTSIILSLFIISPFIGLMFVTPWNNMYVYSSTPTFASLRNTITILIWNVNGYDMTTTYVHKVDEPEQKYFWAYIYNIIGIYLMMFLVFCLGTHYIHDTSQWSDGAFVSMASQHGLVFKWWMGLSALAMSFGVLTAELCSTSYLYNGLTLLGFSKIFQNRTFNLVVNMILLCCGVLIKLDTLISLSAILNTLTLNCEIITWIKVKGLSYWRVIFSCWLFFNNMFIMYCFSMECIISILVSFGLAFVFIWLSEFSISKEENI